MAPRRDPKEIDRIPASGLIAPPPIQVDSPKFQGTLAMLFACVRDRKIDLRDVPLFPICSAYYVYLVETDTVGLEEAAAALTALAYLLERKAWCLLPSAEPEPEMEEPAELPPPTVHEFQPAIEYLLAGHEARTRTFFRPVGLGPDPYEIPYTLGEATANDLARALAKLLERATPEVEILNKPRRSLSEQMSVVLASLGRVSLPLEQLVPEPFTRQEAVWWFLALLELVRLGQATITVEGEDVLFGRALREAAR